LKIGQFYAAMTTDTNYYGQFSENCNAHSQASSTTWYGKKHVWCKIV